MPKPTEETADRPTHSVIEMILESGMHPKLPDHLEPAIKFVAPDWTTYNNFQWWQPGRRWINSPDDKFDPDTCTPGGLHVAYSIKAAQSGGHPPTHTLWVGTEKTKHGPLQDDKRKALRVYVAGPLDLLKIIRRHGAYTSLQRADLQGAYLYRADLRGADLQGANLLEADLHGADLQGAYLQQANLQRADLQGAYLQKANLQQANLRGANLYRADLRGANLQRADLQGAYLQKANLQRANLRGANLQEANLTLNQLKDKGAIL